MRKAIRIIAAIVLAVLIVIDALALSASAGIHTARLNVGRHGVVTHSSLPHCAYEDGGEVEPCTWNIGRRQDGNGRGLAYWIDREDRTHYVWASDPLVNHPQRRWVTRELADALAEGGGQHADTRDWQRCWFTAKGPEQLDIEVACPGGLRLNP